MPARFHIKVNPFGGFALRDRWSPAFVRSYPTIGEAATAMDNRVRVEAGMPPRPHVTRDEIAAAMIRRGGTAAAAPLDASLATCALQLQGGPRAGYRCVKPYGHERGESPDVFHATFDGFPWAIVESEPTA